LYNIGTTTKVDPTNNIVHKISEISFIVPSLFTTVTKFDVRVSLQTLRRRNIYTFIGRGYLDRCNEEY